MQQLPLVTVIVPSYNHAEYIDEALCSIFSQTWKNLEVLVVDDGSTDDTPSRLLPWSKRGIRVISQKNKGASAARNRGIELARGEYIVFLDADDLWPQVDMLAAAVQLLQSNPEFGWTFGDAQPFRMVGASKDFIDGPYLLSGKYYAVAAMVGERRAITPQDLCNNDRFFIPTGTLVVRKQCFAEVGAFDVNLKMFEDTDMWMRLLKYPVAFFPAVLLHRRVHGDNISHRRWAHLKDLQTLFDRYNLSAYGVSFDFHAARAHFGSGREALRQRAFATAAQSFQLSLHHRWAWRTLAWYAVARSAHCLPARHVQ